MTQQTTNKATMMRPGVDSGIDPGVGALTQARVDAARVFVTLHTNGAIAFYGRASMMLRDRITTCVPTAATDGRTIAWNPAFVATLTDAQLRGLLLHETMHPAHGHPWRLRPDYIGNVAGDHEINLILKDVQLGRVSGIELPPDGMCDERFRDMACEEIDHMLRDEQRREEQQQEQQEQSESSDDSGTSDDSAAGSSSDDATDGDNNSDDSNGGASGNDDDTSSSNDANGNGDSSNNGDGDGSNASGDASPSSSPNGGGFVAPGSLTLDDDGQPLDETAREQLASDIRESWDREMVAITLAQQLAGKETGAAGMRRIGELRKAAELDWRSELASFVRNVVSSRPDWSRPARRHATAPVIVPSRRRDDFATVVVVRDSSGSVTDDVCRVMTDAAQSMSGQTGAQLIVMDCDDTVRAEYRLENGDDVPVRMAGGGCTDFRPPFTRVRELIDTEGIHVAGVVYLTDLYGTEPNDDEVNGIEVLWLSTTAGKVARTGRTIHIHVEA